VDDSKWDGVDGDNKKRKGDKKMSMKDKRKMIQRVEDWIGSDSTREDLIDIIAQIAMLKYDPKLLREDILSFNIND
jgi:superfamily I DNA and RNA helicase